MRFNVFQLLNEKVGSSRTCPIDDVFECLAATGAGRASGTVTMVRTDMGVWVTGIMGSTAVSTCSRCLTQFSHDVQLSIDEEYVDVYNRKNVDVSHVDAGVFTIDENHFLNLGEAVRQCVITSLPMKPLCQSDCRGICQGCGINVNDELCKCENAQRDTRLAPLMELLSKQNGCGPA